jgi:phosphopentomutase
MLVRVGLDRRMVILVADGVGCGGAEDAVAYGDLGADTLGHLAQRVGGLALPHLEALGLGQVTTITGVPACADRRGAVGVMAEASAGKDTITGHWEMAGVVTAEPFATFPAGFPREITGPLATVAGQPLLGNKPASGTAIIDELGPTHLAGGGLILYTSADSVLQIAAHEEVIPLGELYRICEAAREICDRHRIGRVIARPFVGQPGAFRRTYNRKDWPIDCPEDTLLDRLSAAGVPVVGVGKIGDIFGGRGVGRSLHSEGNADGLRLTIAALRDLPRGLLFVNLVDFDMLYGHRNDCAGFGRALEELDAWIPLLLAELKAGDIVFVTADHGNDPTTPGTDHTREHVPLLAFGPPVRPVSLGVRRSFCDLGQTVAEALGIAPLPRGESFLGQIDGLIQ